MNELLTMSATAMAQKIHLREITSRDAVEAHIAKIQEVNPTLNAVVVDRFEAARKEADHADQMIAEGREDLPPLHGVPCTIKECFALVGMPNTAGLVARRDFRPSEDATTVSRLRQAGAIPMGVTNTSELCMWMESNNRVYGRTNNPYNPDHIVGGSSGGEGAIIGAGASPFGLGSDIGGSIRMPAFFNGVFGHKPSGGLVPGSGQFPISEGEALRYLTTGPLCRRAEDIWPLLTIMAGPDGIDEGCRPFELGDPGQVDLKTLRVLNVPGNGVTPVDASLIAAQSRVADHLQTTCREVTYREFEAFQKSFDIWSSMLGSAESGSAFRTSLERPSVPSLLWQLLLWMTRTSPHTLPALLLGLLENTGELTPQRTRQSIEAGQALRQELDEALGDDGVMLFPSYAMPAPKHYRPMLPPLTFSWVYTAILNVMETAVTQVPLGLNDDGLPVGVQVVAKSGNDHLTVAVALELQRKFGGWIPPWAA